MSHTQEKNITFSISKRLKHKLNKSTLFKVIMIRNGNYYLSISKRTKIAKKNNVNVLISIHANSSKNSKIFGLSTWVISKKRINSEINNLSKSNNIIYNIKALKNNKKHVLKKKIDLYLKLDTLKLRFKRVQKTGYILAKNIIKELKNTNSIYQINPKCANFGILKSPYFPSILIETGFISNKLEEKKLNNALYQKKLVNSIYLGLKKYYFKHHTKTK
ncbi:MAG: N-acetylmuramoyl-L-alanine amidase [Buchnera aphidicola (Meitanaphis elongallis)]